jgi:peptidoglycan hydrolase CwlO-like protein
MEDEATDEKHFADVRTDKGLVIEFQNSPITPPTIRQRETFYGNMIWVVNANTYKDSFVIASRVTSEVKKFEDTLLMKEFQIKADIDAEIKEQETKVNNLQNELKDAIEDTKKLQRRIDEYQEDIAKYKGLSEKIIKWITNSEGNIEVANGGDLYDYLRRSYKERLLSIMNSICQDVGLLNKTEKELLELTSLEDDEIDGRRVKKIAYDKITEDNYLKVYLIDRGSKKTLFRNYQRIRDKPELFRYKYSTDKFDFLMDKSEDITRFQQSIENLTAEKRNHEQALEQVKDEIAQLVKKWLSRQATSSQEKLERLNNIRIPALTEKYDRERAFLENTQNSKVEKLQAALEDLEQKNENDKWKIRMENKGLYRYKWKRENKAWRAASRPVFFDIGEDYLFEKIDNNSFRKVRMEEFIKSVRL